jgi:hypothetical protein
MYADECGAATRQRTVQFDGGTGGGGVPRRVDHRTVAGVAGR